MTDQTNLQPGSIVLRKVAGDLLKPTKILTINHSMNHASVQLSELDRPATEHNTMSVVLTDLRPPRGETAHDILSDLLGTEGYNDLLIIVSRYYGWMMHGGVHGDRDLSDEGHQGLTRIAQMIGIEPQKIITWAATRYNEIKKLDT